MTPQDFIGKWQRANLSERSAAQQHFLDLCDLLDQDKPAAADPDGTWYTFERGVHKLGGDRGWADVWMKGHFAWEYKGKHKDLVEAYKQLQLYREDLENPPLLVVCDMDRFEIHTNFTNTATRIYQFKLDSLAEPENLDVLRKVFTEPEALRPGVTTETITQEVAKLFGRLVDGMRERKIPAQAAAHFLMKLMFCMFAEDIDLLPEKLFSKVLSGARRDPAGLMRRLQKLFEAMATGGEFGADTILHFNGGLFADADVVELTPVEIEELVRVNDCDWSNVEPSIFGTLFVRTLDPSQRSQIGAEYTSKEDILTVLEPVAMAPLRREWAEVRAKGDKLWTKIQEGNRADKKPKQSKAPAARKAFDKLLTDFGHRLAEVKVLDPACGSGNFLYVAINLLLDLEKEVIGYASQRGLSWFPLVRPSQLAGIEINPYAQQLAQVVIWIGYLQWLHHNGFKTPSNPVLEPIENIRLMDAILDLSDPENPKEPEWPEADFIVGNPPFLGGNRIRQGLGDDYVEALFSAYQGRVPGFADLCCYWFEKARKMIQQGNVSRAGLLATQGIRGGANRDVLKRIKESGEIFFAISDRDWILDGANVHISIVGFDANKETKKILDGRIVDSISADLSGELDVTRSKRFEDLAGLHLEGVKKGAHFHIDDGEAFRSLSLTNPHGKANSDVILPYYNGADLIASREPGWIVYFPAGLDIAEAALYEAPFEYVRKHVFPEYGKKREKWWIHERPRPEMRKMLACLKRYLSTVKHSKYRLFVWLTTEVLVSNAIEFFAREDDYFFGVLHSRLHEVWGLKLGTRLETRPRYTPTTCFETFPFPQATEYQKSPIAGAARELDQLRTSWLNPPEWTREEVLEFPGSGSGPWARYIHDPDARGIGIVRYPRLVAKDEESSKNLAKRTLTNLYNQRPTWLDLAHRKLDEAVFASYGWDPAMSDEEILAKLLELNLARAQK